ncbi:MAG: permease prefix domain 1-containing protein [Schumannella sp.]
MTATLTDRYIWAVQRSLPEQQRDDIDRELRGSIADAIDARVEAGADAGAAERETIVELGDPYRLAAGYADRPLHLIGPALFPDYIRLMKVLYGIVLPIAVVGVTLGVLLSQPDSAGEVIGAVAATAMGLIVHLGFWTTLVFAVIERANAGKPLASAWNPDMLPDLPATGAVRIGEPIASAVFLLIMTVLVLWQQLFPFVTDDRGEGLPVLAPALWTLWLPVLAVIAVLELAFAIAVYRAGRWSVPFAVVNAVLALAAGGILVWLFTTNQFFDPRFAAQLEIGSLVAPGGVLAVVFAFVAAGVAVWDIVDGALKTWRQRRPVASSNAGRTSTVS